MTVLVAVLTTLGVLVALLSNATNILKYVQERRERAAARTGQGASARRTRTTGSPAGGRPGDAGNGPRAQPAVADAPGPSAPALAPADAILTPDQRLRVFVSSTLTELAEERASAQQAIEELKLSPVLFELGARPHAPRDLYHAYLAQSQVFVGIYWQSYGWVAPGETISGLEDEYLLAGDRPRLIYVKEPAERREPRLVELLDRVRREDRASYKRFRTAQELQELLQNDLALLLTERFQAPAPAYAAPSETASATLRLPQPPLPLTTFVGREELLAELVALLPHPTTRLVTLVGPGGIGKSRIALEACRRLAQAFEDGIAYVSLDVLRDPALLGATIARELGLGEIPGREPEARLAQALAARRILLVLDNFEGLLDAAPLVARLLQRAPRLTVMVTSRSLLRIGGELAFPVPPMRVPPASAPTVLDEVQGLGAVRLFVERARAVNPDFRLDQDNVHAVVEICRRLDGLPLALELAAARLRTLTADALLERMTRVLPLLTGGTRDAPARQRTLRSTIEWSYALLDEAEQRLFRLLAVFTGGCALDAIETVFGDGPEVLDRLASLSDKSLLLSHDEGGPERYRMLETVREYALEHFAKDPERPEVNRRHAAYYLAYAERAAGELTGAQQGTWLARLRIEEGNLRGALATLLEAGPSVDALRMCVALRSFWMGVGAVGEGRARVSEALAKATDAPPELLARGLVAAGVLAWRQGDVVRALPLLERALASFRAIGDRVGEAGALRALGVLGHNQARYRDADTLLRQSLALYRAEYKPEGVANVLLSLGNVRLDQGEAGAIELYRESRAIAQSIGDTLGVAHAVDNLGVAAWYFDHPEEADRLSDEAAALYTQLGHPAGGANVAHRRGLLAFARGDLAAAERRYLEALRTRRSLGDARGCAFVLYDLARVQLRRNDLARAQALLREGFELAREQALRVIEVLYLEGTARLLDRQGHDEQAYRLLLAAGAMRVSLGVPVAPVNRASHARHLRGLSQCLEPEARRRAEAEAQDLSYEAALARAEAVLRQMPAAVSS